MRGQWRYYLFGQLVRSPIGRDIESASRSDHIVGARHFDWRKTRPVGIKV